MGDIARSGPSHCTELCCTMPAGALSWGSLALVANSPSATVACLLLGSAATACADVVADSIVVELSRGEPQVGLEGLQRLSRVNVAAVVR